MTAERMLPLYEGKMGWIYDHRYGSFFGTGDADIAAFFGREEEDVVLPRYWVRDDVVKDRLSRRDWKAISALMGFRRVARNTDERTSIASMIPYGAASYGWIVTAGPSAWDLALLISQFNSHVFDYVLRQFLSQPSIPQGTFAQLPILERSRFSMLDPVVGDGQTWIVRRVLALTGAGEEMAEWRKEFGELTPIPWSARRREMASVELDAAMLILFGVGRSDAAYILESFHVEKRKDIAEYGTYRTKELILECYDAMAAAIESGAPYESPLDVQLEVDRV